MDRSRQLLRTPGPAALRWANEQSNRLFEPWKTVPETQYANGSRQQYRYNADQYAGHQSVGTTKFEKDQPPTLNELIIGGTTEQYMEKLISPDLQDSDGDSDCGSPQFPNKYPVQIEDHFSRECGYVTQKRRSGVKLKQHKVTIFNRLTGQPETEMQQIKYYHKHLVRTCRCGKYLQMDGALQQGRNNDCDGYEIHYSQKCRWKAYDDFKTGKRVLIRLCKCYKPV